MKYVVIRTDSERETVVVGKSASKKEAENILRNDFEEWFWQKVTASKDASFEEVYALYEDDECKLSEDSAWLNGCHHTDFDWVILDAETEDVLSKPMSMKGMWFFRRNLSLLFGVYHFRILRYEFCSELVLDEG